MSTTPDAALVAAVADGDAGALRELYERHGAWLHARLIRRCNDPEVVVEVVQDTFVAQFVREVSTFSRVWCLWLMKVVA